MTVLGAGADGVLGLLGAALLHGTLLAAVALVAAATVLRRARPGVIAALWTVVLLKFLVPIGPGARWSLASLVDGLRAPIVVVPAAALAAEHADARAAALVHELAHVRRGDAALRVVQAVAATAFFFFPVVRWVNRRLDLAREQACDAYAIALGPLGPTAYARMLVEAARARLEAPAAGLALARRGQLRRRVDALVDRPARAGLGRAGALVVGAWALIGLTGAASSASPHAPERPVCRFTPEVASSIMAAFPEADLDGDGALSRDEVCDFQLELRRRHGDEALASLPDDLGRELSADGALASALASEDLCCNCLDPAAGGATSRLSAGAPATESTAIPTCVRGVSP